MPTPPPPNPTSFDRIFADIRKDVPSVPDAVVQQEIFRVMDDFTQHTNIWQEGVQINIVPNLWSYDFTTQTGKPYRLLTMFDFPVFASPSTLPPPPPPPPPTAFWPDGPASMRVPGTLLLRRAPITANNRMIIVAKRVSAIDPTNNYPVIDDWIVDKYADTLGRGILARLQLSPQKPWSNPMLAQPNQRAYISGRSEARVSNEKGNVFDAQTWQFPQSWSTVTRKAWA